VDSKACDADRCPTCTPVYTPISLCTLIGVQHTLISAHQGNARNLSHFLSDSSICLSIILGMQGRRRKLDGLVHSARDTRHNLAMTIFLAGPAILLGTEVQPKLRKRLCIGSLSETAKVSGQIMPPGNGFNSCSHLLCARAKFGFARPEFLPPSPRFQPCRVRTVIPATVHAQACRVPRPPSRSLRIDTVVIRRQPACLSAALRSAQIHRRRR